MTKLKKLLDTYSKFKHLDVLIMDTNEHDPLHAKVLKELWVVVKELMEGKTE